MIISHGGAVELAASMLNIIHGNDAFEANNGILCKCDVSPRLYGFNTGGIVPKRNIQISVECAEIYIIPWVSKEASETFIEQAWGFIRCSGFPYTRNSAISETHRFYSCHKPAPSQMICNSRRMSRNDFEVFSLTAWTKNKTSVYFRSIVHDMTREIPINAQRLTPSIAGIRAEYLYEVPLYIIDSGRMRVVNKGTLSISKQWNDAELIGAKPPPDDISLVYPQADTCAFCETSLEVGGFLLEGKRWTPFTVKACDLCAGGITSHVGWIHPRNRNKVYQIVPIDKDKQDALTRKLLEIGADTNLSVIKHTLDKIYTGPDLLISGGPGDFPELCHSELRLGHKYTCCTAPRAVLSST
jgi:hypothetical protein